MPVRARRRGAQRGLFDLWSLFYDLPPVQWATYWPVHDAVVRALGAERATSVLDIGCGTGQLTVRVKHELAPARVAGCDYSRGMLRQARRRSADVGWVQGDAGALPFRDGAFDAVISTEAFHWFPDQRQALTELFRVLAPGGRLFLALVSSPAGWVGAALRTGSELLGEPFYWPTRDDLRRWLAEAGFGVVEQERIARLPGGILFPPLLTIAAKPLEAHSSPARTAAPM
jgi:ubiquinone/menaquinone biosynthesis C-methylase UbiE